MKMRSLRAPKMRKPKMPRMPGAAKFPRAPKLSVATGNLPGGKPKRGAAGGVGRQKQTRGNQLGV